jgi:hypothetical protein
MLLLQLIIEHLVLCFLLDYVLLKVMQLGFYQQVFIIEALSFMVEVLGPCFSTVDLVFEVLEHKTGIETHSAH